MKYIVSLLMFLFIATSCNNKRAADDESMNSSPMMTGFPASSNNSEIAERELDTPASRKDYYGTYQGTLPAADAEGIKTKLTLYDDNTYVLESVYLGKADNSFKENGKYSVVGEVLTLQTSGANQYYKISEGYLTKLNEDRQEITGELADNYRLTKE